jgi:subtilisin family serine protease
MKRFAACSLVLLVAGEACGQVVRVPPSLYQEFEIKTESADGVRALVAFERPKLEIPRPQILSDQKALNLHIESAALEFSRTKQSVLVDLPGIEIERDFRHLPIALVRIKNRGRLESLAQRKGIRAINPIVNHRASFKEGGALVRQPQAYARGASGDGVAVVVADTGVDYAVKGLGECKAPGALCPVVYAEDVAVDDGMRDDRSKHGTNVAAIVLAMAPKAKIIALDVFHEGYASKDKVIAAVNWAVANKTKYNIVAINLSLGSQAYKEPCVESVYLDAFRQAASVGIVAVTASGNDAWPNAIEEPACAPNAVSVGAVYDAPSVKSEWPGSECSDLKAVADTIPCFSNGTSFLTTIAPGAMIDAGGVSMGGTSQAAAFVSGAIAVLAAKYPGISALELVGAIQKSGKAILDTRSGIKFHRLDLEAALEYAKQKGW